VDLIIWRHAEAEDGVPDLERRLTAKGRKQAERVAQWLLQRLPARFAVIASPAARAQQTAEALGVPVKTDRSLAPGAAPAAIVKACGWPS
jgi:phosphohistidine phosphatase